MKKLFIVGAVAAAAVAAAAIITKKKKSCMFEDDDFICGDCCCDDDYACGCEDEVNEIPAEKAECDAASCSCGCAEEEILDKVEDQVESDEV